MNQCDGVVANCFATWKLLKGTRALTSSSLGVAELGRKGSYKEKSAHAHETVAVVTMIPG